MPEDGGKEREMARSGCTIVGMCPGPIGLAGSDDDDGMVGWIRGWDE